MLTLLQLFLSEVAAHHRVVAMGIEDRAGGLLDQRDELIAQRLWLQNELDNVGAG